MLVVIPGCDFLFFIISASLGDPGSIGFISDFDFLSATVTPSFLISFISDFASTFISDFASAFTSILLSTGFSVDAFGDDFISGLLLLGSEDFSEVGSVAFIGLVDSEVSALSSSSSSISLPVFWCFF